MKKSELIAKYWAYGEDIIPVTEEEYDFMFNMTDDDLKEFDTMPRTVSTYFIEDGYAYYAFVSQHYLGSTDSDTYYFKLKCGSGEIATEY